MIRLIRHNRFFFILLLLYFITGAALLIYFEKGEIELWVNRHHHFWNDYFFSRITFLGDGYFALALVLVLLLLRSVYQAAVLGLSVLSTSLPVQSCKRFFFSHEPRPLMYFKDYPDIHLVNDVEVHSYHSFPSGHSAQAFAIFLSLALLTKNKTFAPTFFSLAFLTAYSRVYLFQHFFIDTYFGAFFAVIMTFITYIILTKSRLGTAEKFQTGLLNRK